ASGEDLANASDARGHRTHDDASSSSIASEQPRGGAPGVRPTSSTTPPAHRPRSAVCTATAPSTLARSSKRKMPSSPSGSGASVSGSTATTRSHGGGTNDP